MKLEVGKYYTFGGKGSYIVGPMEVDRYRDDVLRCGASGENFYKDTGRASYGNTTLVEEFTLPETVPMNAAPKLGMAVLDTTTRGIFFINYINRWDGYDVRGYECSTSSDYRRFVRVPSLDLTTTEASGKYARVGDELFRDIRTNIISYGESPSYPTHVKLSLVGTQVPGGASKHFSLADVVEWFAESPFPSVIPVNLTLKGNYVTMEKEAFPDATVENTLANGGLWLRISADGTYWTFYNFKENETRSVYVYGESLGWKFKTQESVSFNDPVLDEFSLVDDPIDPYYDMNDVARTLWILIPDSDLANRFKTRCMLTHFRQSTQNRNNLALYLNQKQKDAKRIQSLRPGRAIRALLPEVTDALIEQMVDAFRKNFPTNEYAVKRGFAAEDFKHMYAHPMMAMQNPRTTDSRKSLGNSCMRHADNFKSLPHHPAEAYASGEFEAIWSENTDGRIASRLVVWHPPQGHRLHGKPQCGPVYGTCEYSIDLLEDVARDMGAQLYDGATWGGAKWQKLPYHDGVIAPYSDHEQSIEDCGDYLKVGGDCDYEASNYGGVLGGSDRNGFDCDECGTYIDPDCDDYFHTDRGCICYSCRDRSYFYCEDYEEDHPRDEMCTVYRSSRWGRDTRYVCEAARDENYVLCIDNDEYWHIDDATQLANEDWISPEGKSSGDYAECVSDDNWYPVTEMYPLVKGGYVARDNFDETTHALNDLGEVYEREAA